MTTFKELGLKPEILKALEEIGFETPTEVQEKAIPLLVQENQDLIALSQTGTGKTAAFGLPLLEKVDIDHKKVQTIVLCPTRELCLQIAKDVETYSKYMKGFRSLAVYGGTNIQPQIKALDKGVHMVVATPGRCLDLIKRRKLKLDDIEFVVLDEADEMLNMGFKEDLDDILSNTPEGKQTLLFSATMSKEIARMAKNYMSNPAEISVGTKNSGAKNVEHQYYLVNNSDRYEALKRIADSNLDIYGIVFCRTRRATSEVASNLMQDGYSAEALHGDMSQGQRDDTMARFRKGALQLLVATDVAARGLDVNELTHVINYQLPDEQEIYVHRSGRTGRAGNKGICVSILSPSDKKRIKPLERIIQQDFKHVQLPSGSDICKTRLFSLIEKINNTEVNEAQIEPFMETVYEKFAEVSKEELIKKIVHTEFNQFLEYYKNKGDINLKPRAEREGREGRERGGRERYESDDKFQRYHLNIGKKDELNVARLMGLVNENLNSRDAEIGKIEVLSNFSFFEVDKDFCEKLESSFNKGVSFEDRDDVRIEKAQSRGAGSGGGDRRNSDRRGGGGGDRRGGGGGGYNRGGGGGDRRSGGGGGYSRGGSDRGGSDRSGGGDRRASSDRRGGGGRRR
jgi:ATP-dependent RNA helicase DeaD